MPSKTPISLRKISISLFVGLPLNLKVFGSLLLALISFSALVSAISVTSIVPFVSILQGVSVDNDIPFMNFLTFSDTSKDYILFLFVGLILASSSLSILSVYLSSKFSSHVAIHLSCESFSKIIRQDLLSFNQTNSSSGIAALSNFSLETVGFTTAFCNLTTSTFIFSLTVLTLLLIKWQITIFIFIAISFSYIVLSFFSNRALSRNSKIITTYTEFKINLLADVFGNYRDVIVSKSQNFYQGQYHLFEATSKNLQSINTFMALSPKYFLELIGVVLLVSISLLPNQFFISEGSLNSLTLIALYAYAFQKLLPASQQIYSSQAAMRARAAAVQKLLDFKSIKEFYTVESPGVNHLSFNSSIELQNLSFKYPGSGSYVLDNINLLIQKSARIGIVGESGCGKSTLIDLLMCTLYPSSGSLLCDNNFIYSNTDNPQLDVIYKYWNNLAHVPQSIFILDDTPLANVAFCIPDNEIDFNLVVECCKIAEIHTFISSLPNGYLSRLGERGSSLSGGQRQRIGLARALYKDPQLLILDEATSALDFYTEQKVLSNINKFRPNLAIITIAHNQSALSFCDEIYTLSNGKLIAS